MFAQHCDGRRPNPSIHEGVLSYQGPSRSDPRWCVSSCIDPRGPLESRTQISGQSVRRPRINRQRNPPLNSGVDGRIAQEPAEGGARLLYNILSERQRSGPARTDMRHGGAQNRNICGSACDQLPLKCTKVHVPPCPPSSR